MDTIRKKMYLLKLETSDTINRLLTVETAAARNSEALKDREQNLRKLMKEVSKRDNGEIISYMIIFMLLKFEYSILVPATSVILLYIDLELDKLTTQLEKTEKKIREIDHSLHIAKTDKIQLKEGIRLREDQLKLNEINYGTTSSSLTKESAK